MHATQRHPEARIVTRKFSLDDFQGVTAEGAGEIIRHEPIEHAVIYSAGGKAVYYVPSRPGEPKRVTIPFGKTGLIRGNVFVHNHPGSESFSVHDIWILLRHGAREVHVYGPERAFRMIASPRTRKVGAADPLERWRELRSRYERALLALEPLFQQLVGEQILSRDEAWAARTHSVVRELSKSYEFAYAEI